MIGSLTFTRDDGATFTFSAVNPPYQLTPDTQLPAGLTLDVSGGEYTGRNGGYTLAGRLQRRTAKIVYNVRETSSDSRSMVQLLNDAAEFFRPMTADLRIVSFTMLVQTDDSNKSAYLMRQGHVTTPFMAPLLRGGRGSYAAEFDLIFDDPLLYWADGSGVVSGDILPAALPGSKIGEVWQEGLQVWAAGLSRWEYPAQGGGGTPQTVHVVSAYQVPVAFTITGQITNPKIVNSRNGSQWSWEGTIPYGRVVTVDVDGVATDWQGNRLLNTMGGLVAAPGDNTFTLTGSDLVLDLKAAWSNITFAWTGTPNASTSTLSQDGQVVATNLFTDPNALTKTTILTLANSNWTSVNPVADGNHWRVIIDPSWTLAMYDKLFNAWRDTGDVVVITADANADKISVQNGTLISHTGTMAAYRIGASSLGDAGIALRIVKDGLQSGEGITITGYGVYTNDDWQAMQALGVRWFDGDSAPTRISTLSQDGQVVATNLFTNSKPLAAGWYANVVNIVDTPNGMQITCENPGGDVYAESTIPVNTKNTFVVSADMFYSSGATHSNGTLFAYYSYNGTVVNSSSNDVNSTTPGNRTIQITTPDAPVNLCVRLYCANATTSSSTIWSHVGVYTKSDWQAMQARGITWFDGDSAPNTVTAKASVNIRGAF